MISSTLMTGEYERLVMDYTTYRQRQVASLVEDKLDELGSKPPPPPAPVVAVVDEASGRDELLVVAEGDHVAELESEPGPAAVPGGWQQCGGAGR